MVHLKKIVFVLLALLGLEASAQFSVTNPQGICIKGNAFMYIRKDNTLHVDGNFVNNNTSTVVTQYFRSNGTISLTGNLITTSPMICTRASSLTSTCKFIFSPRTDTVNIINNNDSLILYHVILNKPASVIKLGSGAKVKILDTLDFQGGSIQLNGGIVHLNEVHGTPSYINHPYLKNERHSSRIFGDSGYVEMRPLITLSTTPTNGFVNPANLGISLTYTDVVNDSLFLRRGHTKQIYAGNGSITRYFDVIGRGSGIRDSIKINYIDSAEYINLGINRNNFKIFASQGADINYIELPGTNTITAHLADATTTTFTTGNISPNNFRVTVADNVCTNPPVSALPSGTLHLCAGATTILDAGNNTVIPNSSLVWNWSGGSPTVTATTQTLAVTSNTAMQQFVVVLRDVRGCITKDTVFVAATAPTPTVTIYGASRCSNDSLKLKALSGVASGTITNYYWQFGDATTYNTALNDTIKKLYPAAGIYTVGLTVTSNYGCTASATQSVVAIPLPHASFASNFDCTNNWMSFTSTSTVSPIAGSITQNYWNFNTAASSTLTPFGATVSPNYTYTPGTYSVQLVVKTGSGNCRDTITKTITVYQKNVSAFTTSNACLGDTVSFANTSVCNTGPCNYAWDFGDASQSVALNPKHVYTGSGAYNIKLKVFNTLACTDSVTVPVIISPKPNIAFTTASPLCLGNASYFTNTTSIATGSIVSYNWNFGNGSTSTNTNTSLTYTAAGNYNVSLTATSNLGCSATLIQNVLIAPKPTAQYNVANACLGQASNFNDNSIGTGLSYQWDFGNTITSTSANPGYTYPSAGTYSTSLIVTNGSGCSDTSNVNTTVFTIPAPALGGIITTCGTSYTLNAGPGTSYLWQPMNATSQSVTITSNGNYSVTVTNANGCTGGDQVYVGLNLPVKPHLGHDTISCGPYLINAGYPGSTYSWNTGAITQTILATATLPSTYIVTVTDINNCVGKDTVVVSVNTPPTLSLGPNITQCKTAQGVTLVPTTNASIYLWSNGSTQPTLNVNNNGNYALTVTAANGCKTSDTINVNLLPSPVVNLGADATVCGSRLLDAQNTGFSYLWSTSNTTQTITAVTTGSYAVTVTNMGNGCVGKDTINLIINTPINVFLGNDTSTCSNNTFVLNAGNAGSSYNWSNGLTTQTVVVGSSGAYGVTVTNGACSAFDAVTISVLNAPVINLGNNIRYLCGNGYVVLNAGSTGTVSWGSSNGFSSSQHVVSVSQTGNYWATISNGACSSSDTVQVIQSNLVLNAYFIASTVDTVGKPVKFVDVSEPAPTTWSWDFGDGFYSTEQSPEHAFLTAQTYSVTLLISNGFCESQITKALQVLRKASVIPKENPTSLGLLNFGLYPNPADRSFKTILELNDVANIDFTIYDVTGKMVYKLFKNQVSVFDEEINIDFLKNGLYMVEVVAQSNKGFVKQKSKLVVVK